MWTRCTLAANEDIITLAEASTVTAVLRMYKKNHLRSYRTQHMHCMMS
jgi:hypothetical protein